jgi:hypothetical protein
LATAVGKPRKIRTGSVNRDPPPATVFKNPANTPTTTINAISISIPPNKIILLQKVGIVGAAGINPFMPNIS